MAGQHVARLVATGLVGIEPKCSFCPTLSRWAGFFSFTKHIKAN